MRKRKGGVCAVVLVVAAGAVGVSVWRRTLVEERALVMPPLESIDPSVPESKLLNSVLYIDAWRRFGRPVGFFSVPKSRPPGLTSIGPGNPPNLNGGSHVGSGNGARIDSYHLELAGFRLFAFAEFSAGPTSTCKATKEIAQATCVRDGALSASAVTDTRYRHLTVYFTTDDASAVTTPEAQRAERFWADVEMVPVGEAQWFTDLAGRARAAVK